MCKLKYKNLKIDHNIPRYKLGVLGSSLPLVICRSSHVLLSLYVCYRTVVFNIYCVVVLLCSQSCVPYPLLSISLEGSFLNALRYFITLIYIQPGYYKCTRIPVRYKFIFFLDKVQERNV
jgi:hypothetical protein